MTPAELIYSKFEMTRDQVNKTHPRLQTREQSLVSSLRSLAGESARGRGCLQCSSLPARARRSQPADPTAARRGCRSAVPAHHDPSRLLRARMMLALPARGQQRPSHRAAGGAGPCFGGAVFRLPRCRCPPGRRGHTSGPGASRGTRSGQ